MKKGKPLTLVLAWILVIAIVLSGNIKISPGGLLADEIEMEQLSYEVKLEDSSFGTLACEEEVYKYTPGEKVKVIITPQEGCQLSELQINTAGGKTVAYENGENTVTFTMPEENVVVESCFVEADQESETEAVETERAETETETAETETETAETETETAETETEATETETEAAETEADTETEIDTETETETEMAESETETEAETETSLEPAKQKKKATKAARAAATRGNDGRLSNIQIYGYPKGSSTFYRNTMLSIWTINPNGGSDRKVAFCLQFGVGAGTGDGFDGTGYDLASKVGTEAAEKLILGAYYGYYEKFTEAAVGQDWQNLTDERAVQYAVTQTYVWETLGANITTFNVDQDGVNRKNNIENAVQEFLTLPSFNDSSITIKPGETITVSDANHVVEKYIQGVSPTGIEITREGNNLKITAASNAVSGTVTFSRFLNSGSGGYFIANNSKQDIGVLTGMVTKRAKLQIKVLPTGTSTGEVGVQKVDKDNQAKLIPGATLVIKNADSSTPETFITWTTTSSMKTITLQPGNYYVQEIAAPPGYVLNTQKYPFTVKANDTALVNFVRVTNEKEQDATGGFEVIKYNQAVAEQRGEHSEDKDPMELIEWSEIGTRSNAEFQLLNADKEHISTHKTDFYGKIEFTNLAAGTYYLIETDNPDNVGLSKDEFKIVVLESGKTTLYRNGTKVSGLTYEIINETELGQVEIWKVDKDDKATNLPGAIFKITQYKQNDPPLPSTEITFTTTDRPTKISLAPGYYILEEIKAPDGYEVIESDDPIYIEVVNGSTTSINVYKIENEKKGQPAISTKAFVTNGDPEKPEDKKAYIGADTKISDRVIYENLTPDSKYVLEAQLIRKKDDAVLTSKTHEFTPSNASGYVDVDLPAFASWDLKGEEVVVYETLKLNDKVVATHTEKTDKDQTITFINPSVGTTAKDSVSGTNTGIPSETITIIDTVEYKNLEPGKDYTVKGILMTKDAAGNAVKFLDEAGREVVAEKPFKATKSDDSVELSFTFSKSSLAGVSIVVYEDLYLGTELIASHKNIDDKGQTVEYLEQPDISTSAKDSETGEHVSNPDEEVTIIDTVTYKGLLVGKTYTVKGVLMDKGTGEKLMIDNKPVEGKTTFVAEVENGTVEIEFKLNASALAGKAVVVFESIERDGIEVGSHTDIDDEEQSIYFPKIGTKAEDSETHTHTGLVKETVTIIDTVRYENLIKGKTYTIKGKLVDQTTGEPLLDGKNEITASKEFVAEAETGSVQLTFTLDSSALAGKSVVVYEKLYAGIEAEISDKKQIGSHEDPGDDAQTVNYPKITTDAKDSETKDHHANPDEEVTIIDVVTYTNLTPGIEYTIKGVLMDKATGEPLLVGGEEIRAEKTFTPEEPNGTEELVFTFAASALKGETIVVFETLYYKDKEVTSHTDITDEDQTIYFPDLGTKAEDSETHTHDGVAGTEVTIIDTVSCKNLIVGKTYTVKGKLMNKETGEPLLVNKTEITAEAQFTAKESDESVQLTFTFNGSDLEGLSVVVYEKLYLGVLAEVTDKDEIGSHEDIEDPDQTVNYPGITTDAKDSENGSHISNPDEEVTIIDVVTYTNLTPGTEYTVKGVLMDKKTQEPLLVDGEEVRAEKTFTPEKANGTVELHFTFKASALAGETVVVFETLYQDDREVASHTDIDDEDQTIYFPEIGTKAEDSETHTHNGVAGTEVTIIDTVSYKNLIAGKTYTVKGKLMNKETGESIMVNGNEITAETEFEAEATEGSVQLTFTFDGSALEGVSVVVFEKLYLGVMADVSDKDEVGSHEDIEDPDQTVNYPGITTNAKDGETGESVSNADKDITIIDVVTYKNLVPGTEYTVKGVLMDKATGEQLLVNGQEIRAERDFVPEEPNGSIELTFTFDASALQGQTIVVFEKLFVEEKEVAAHEDIEDEDQTVQIKPTHIQILKTDEEGNPLEGAKLQILDQAGNVIEEWTSKKEAHTIKGKLQAGETYQLKEIEAPEGYLLAETISFTVNRTGELIEVVMKDKKAPEYSITVTKYVRYNNVDVDISYTFYAALFSDQECTNRVSDVAELKLEDTNRTTAVFEGLKEGIYYLAETDQDGNPLDFTSEEIEFTNEIENTSIELTPQKARGEAGIINHMKNPPDGYLRDNSGEITIDKTVMAGNTEKKVTDTFYFTVFSDEALENIVETQALDLNDASAGSVTFKLLLYGTYYIAETDEDGIPVDGDYTYTVSIDQDSVTLSADNRRVKVKVVNTSKEKQQDTDTSTTERTGTTTTRTISSRIVGLGAKTGDYAQFMLYALILAGAGIAFVSAVLGMKRRKRR